MNKFTDRNRFTNRIKHTNKTEQAHKQEEKAVKDITEDAHETEAKPRLPGVENSLATPGLAASRTFGPVPVFPEMFFFSG